MNLLTSIASLRIFALSRCLWPVRLAQVKLNSLKNSSGFLKTARDTELCASMQTNCATECPAIPDITQISFMGQYLSSLKRFMTSYFQRIRHSFSMEHSQNMRRPPIIFGVRLIRIELFLSSIYTKRLVQHGG